MIDEEVDESIDDNITLSVSASFTLHTKYQTIEKYTFKNQSTDEMPKLPATVKGH